MPHVGKIPVEPDREPTHQARLGKTARKRKRDSEEVFDAELTDLPEPARWRIWMGRVEAVIFASPHPVMRETLAPLVGKTCVFEDILEDIAQELKTRPYELAFVGGGYQIRTRPSMLMPSGRRGSKGIGSHYPNCHRQSRWCSPISPISSPSPAA